MFDSPVTRWISVAVLLVLTVIVSRNNGHKPNPAPIRPILCLQMPCATTPMTRLEHARMPDPYQSYTPTTLEEEWRTFVANGYSYSDHCRRILQEPLDRLYAPSFMVRQSGLVEPIEPLIGLLRNPRAICLKSINVEDRKHVILLNRTSNADAFDRMWPGRRYLFDSGSGLFKTSLQWYIAEYAQRGIEFDGIFAWEAKVVPPDSYWDAVPPSIRARLHYYNIPISSELMHPSNPLTTLLSIVRPGDFVVFKLDIDTPAIENVIVQQYLNSTFLRDNVAEFFWEIHFRNWLMKSYGWMNPAHTWYLHDAYKALRDAREKYHLRWHYWP